jgi:hypothetical protein
MKVDLRAAPLGQFFRVCRFFLFSLVAITCFSFSAGAQTVDEVIAKNIQAHGGMEKLKAVRSLRTTAKLTQGSFRADLRQENKRADKVREEFIIQGLAQVQATRQNGMQISPFGCAKIRFAFAGRFEKPGGGRNMDGPLMIKEKGQRPSSDTTRWSTDCKRSAELKNGDVRATT